MKLIKGGVEWKDFHVNCPHCEAQMLVDDLKDLRRYYMCDQREGDVDYLFVECMDCSKRIRVPEHYVPARFRDSIRTVNS